VVNNFTSGGVTFGSQDEGGIQYEKVKPRGATAATMAAVTIDTTRTAVRVAANAERRNVVLRNTGAVTFYIHKTSAFTLTDGLPVDPGQGFATDYTGAIYAATSTGTSVLNYWEDANQ
jgi:hypothetical protein